MAPLDPLFFDIARCLCQGRNETICQLSDALIVIAAGAKSGTMSTARAARRMRVPLHVAVYRDMEDDGYAGNRELLTDLASATPLMWNSAQEEVNMLPVWRSMPVIEKEPILCGQS